MKISVVYDGHGTILAASAFDSHSSSPRAPRTGYDLGGDFDVPNEFDGKKLSEFLPHLRVDVTNQKLIGGAKTD